MKHVLAAALLAVAALAAQAQSSAQAPVASGPTKKQLDALCSQCAIVTATAVERRKGKARGVGAVGGAVAGGVIGNKVGDSTAATVGGAALGGVVGHEIEKRVKRHKVWITTVTLKDGSVQRFEHLSDPQHRLGEVLGVQGEALQRR